MMVSGMIHTWPVILKQLEILIETLKTTKRRFIYISHNPCEILGVESPKWAVAVFGFLSNQGSLILKRINSETLKTQPKTIQQAAQLRDASREEMWL